MLVTKSLVAVIVAIAVACVPRTAAAAPAADVIVVWAPAHDVAPLAAVARDLGAALVDRSPPSRVAPSIDAAIQRGIDAFEALQLDAAWSLFEDARRQLDATGGAGVSNARLSDLFVYRGLIRTQREDVDGAWDELVAAMVVAPGRVFDPARFPPRTLLDLERARKAAGASQVVVAIEAPPACAIAVDGAAVVGREASLVRGIHWIAASCPGFAPWGVRVDVDERADRVRVGAARLEPPSDAEVVIQGRTAGARGMIVVEVRGTLAVARLLGLDGRERDRRSVTIAVGSPRSLEPLAAAVRDLLQPRPSRARWYRSRWAWAAGGALVAAAIFVPLTLAFSSNEPTGVKVVGPGALP